MIKVLWFLVFPLYIDDYVTLFKEFRIAGACQGCVFKGLGETEQIDSECLVSMECTTVFSSLSEGIKGLLPVCSYLFRC